MPVNETLEFDRGFAHIRSELKKAKGAHVDVGIFGGRNPDGSSILAYALANEFGVESGNFGQTIPARPFVKETGRKNERRYRQRLNEGFADLVEGRTVRSVLVQLGLEVQADTVETIRRLQSPPLADATVDRKLRKPGGGGSNPLVDTGAMMRAVTFEVRGQ